MDDEELKKFAKQLAHPQGERGLEIAEAMNASNRIITEIVLQELNPQAGQTVVEIGPGNGLLSLPLLEILGPKGRYCAVDHSVDMIDATKKNLSGRVCTNLEFYAGDPFTLALAPFRADGLFCVNVLYFIENLGDFFALIRTWLAPTGRAVFGVRSQKTLAALPFVMHGFIQRSEQEIAHELERAGFNVNYSYVEEQREADPSFPLEVPFEAVIFTATFPQS